MCLDAFAHPFREGDRGVEHRARKQEHELLAAVSPRPVDLPNLVPQDPRELLEHRVARLVPVLVVHALETIEVAHDAPERFVQPCRVLEHLAQALLEMPPIVETREAVRL
jgi:hypothetical protein